MASHLAETSRHRHFATIDRARCGDAAFAVIARIRIVVSSRSSATAAHLGLREQQRSATACYESSRMPRCWATHPSLTGPTSMCLRAAARRRKRAMRTMSPAIPAAPSIAHILTFWTLQVGASKGVRKPGVIQLHAPHLDELRRPPLVLTPARTRYRWLGSDGMDDVTRVAAMNG
jgi:hypothetical protein